MATYIFSITRRDFYKVEAESHGDAQEKLENCDDLADFLMVGSEEESGLQFYGRVDTGSGEEDI